MSSEDPAAPDTPTIDEAAGSRRSPTRPDDLVQFVSTKGTHITGRHKDKFERITETASDLELARKGAFSLGQRSDQGNSGRWIASLARASSVFFEKNGDRQPERPVDLIA